MLSLHGGLFSLPLEFSFCYGSVFNSFHFGVVWNCRFHLELSFPHQISIPAKFDLFKVNCIIQMWFASVSFY